MSEESAVPRSKRIAALVLEFLSIPGSGLFCLGAKGSAGVHLGAMVACFAVVIFGALWGSPVLFWSGVVFLLVRPFVAAVECFRAAGEAPGWGKLVGVGALGIVLSGLAPDFIREDWVEAFKIPSGSMIPSVDIGDHIFVAKGAAPKVGDIVVYTAGPKRLDFAKRVIAVGPATVRIQGRRVSVNGKEIELSPRSGSCPLAESCQIMTEGVGGGYPVLFQDVSAGSEETFEAFVNQGEIYLLGDNRDASWDSRQHGPVALADVQGVMTMTWWRGGERGGARDD